MSRPVVHKNWPDARHLLPLAPDDERPLAYQIADRIREAIERGDYKQGSRLPGTPTIGRHYRATEDDARLAVHIVAAAGLVRVVGRSGTYVRGVS